MQIISKIARVLMGLLFAFGSIAFLFNLVPQPELSGNIKIFMDGMIASGYLMKLVKITELLCGIAFITGYFVPLAAIIISPVIINILLFSIFLDTTVLPIAIFLVVANVLIAYSHWNLFKSLVRVK